MKTVLLSAAVSMFIALFGTPLAIKTFSRRGYGQEIRSDGPAGHLSKRGTPTMGGTVIIIASLTGYLIGHLVTGNAMSASGLLVLFLMTGLGLVGFADDFIKLYMQRSLGLRSGAKLAGQAVVGGVFALLAIRFPDGYDLTPASTHLSFYADFGISIGPVLFVVWVILMVAGTSNGVNLTDGLDGLATGAAILVLAAYMIIGIWQLRNDCTVFLAQACYDVPLAIKTFSRRGYGQEIRSDGPAGHLSKRGTPTMGGTVIIVASLTGYLIGHVVTGNAMSASGLLVLFLMTGLGLVGFADDFIKLYMQRSLGLRSGAKLAGQAVVGGVFALLAIRFPDGYDLTPASTHLSFYADFGISIGPVLFVVWVIIMVAGTSNGVNLTDGLDGLATGAAILALAAYMIIGIWQLRNDCTVFLAQACYAVRDPQDLAIVAATVMGACAGFLWWNAPPAKIFMGDTGSLALGGALAGLAITTKTELLLLLLGGLFVIITLSVVIQVGSFKLTGKRVFRMAPLQHHFELAGWAETTIVVRFWIIAGICVALGLGIFYVG